jgi:hypothetical protein
MDGYQTTKFVNLSLLKASRYTVVHCPIIWPTPETVVYVFTLVTCGPIVKYTRENSCVNQ